MRSCAATIDSQVGAALGAIVLVDILSIASVFSQFRNLPVKRKEQVNAISSEQRIVAVGPSDGASGKLAGERWAKLRCVLLPLSAHLKADFDLTPHGALLIFAIPFRELATQSRLSLREGATKWTAQNAAS
jgi:hypothetical protein